MFPDEGSLICPPGKSMIFYKKETEKNEVLARPDLFKSIMSHHSQFIRDCYSKTTTLALDPQQPSLKPKLRPYQRNAVLWMLRQETELTTDEDAQQQTHVLWEKVSLKDGSDAYFNTTGGHLVRERPR